jgi:hypothetical protein
MRNGVDELERNYEEVVMVLTLSGEPADLSG